MTESQARGVEIVMNHSGIKPREFARKMWPDSDGWSTMTNCGYGVSKGGGMNLAGGGYLGKLARKGWVRSRNGYYVTSKGVADLKAHYEKENR